MHEIWYKTESSEYREGFFLNEYHKGNDNECFYLSSGREGNEGTNYKEWAFPQDKDRKPREKAIPVSVKLGTRNEAIEVLKKVLRELVADSQGGVEDDVPDF